MTVIGGGGGGGGSGDRPRTGGWEPFDGFVLGTLPALDGRPGPAKQMPDRKRRALIARALDTVYVRSSLTPAPRAKRTVLLQHAVAAAFVFSLGSVATAGVLLYRQREEPPAPVVKVEPAPKQPARRQPRRAAVAPEPELAPLPAPEPEPPARKARPARTSLDALLQSAADLRSAQRWREATETYERVMHAAAPRSDLGHTAAINAAFLRLEHLDDARGARRLFDGVLAAGPRSSLGEEARWGRAQSLRALGDRAGERRALADFLRSHPESIRWARAEARYREIAELP
jgi:hypothetical protein